VYSEKLLMMDRRTVRNMQNFIQKINLRNSESSWFYYNIIIIIIRRRRRRRRRRRKLMCQILELHT